MNILDNNTSFLLDLCEKTLLSNRDKFPLNGLAIIVSPHHDDESIGMGGTIAKLIDNGFKVYIIYVTAEKLNKNKGTDPLRRKAEAIAAAATLGVNNIENISFMDFEDGNLKKIVLDYSKSVKVLQSKIAEIELENDFIDINGENLIHSHSLILTTSRFDAHRDHQETYDLVKNAARKKIILEFPTVNHIASYYVANCIIDISNYYGMKKEALSKYSGEIKKNRILWDDIFKLDHLTGKRLNVAYAESCFISWFGLLIN